MLSLIHRPAAGLVYGFQWHFRRPQAVFERVAQADNEYMDKKMKKRVMSLPAIILFAAACSGPDVSTRVTSSLNRGVLAVEQKVQGKTIIMTPNVEDITDKGFNIRYMELSFGSGVPENIRDLAIDQCKSTGKAAVFMGNSRGLIQFNTVKAHYECRDIGTS